MRCKQGDDAFVTGGAGSMSNLGKVVTCLGLASSDALEAAHIGFAFKYGAIWMVSKPLLWRTGINGHTMASFAPDCFLTPIRGGLEHTTERTEIKEKA
jgi:hypothetical protein